MTVEGRKYGVKMVLGTQNKAQFEEHYGRGAATMLATSHVKILFRCNEPDCARWVSEMIGEQEKERPRIGTTATVAANGRDSINYSTFTERRAVVSREEIMALRNLYGYWKYSDAVVPFRIQGISRPQVALSFVPRDIRSITGQPPPLMLEEPSRQLRLLPPVDPQTEPPERTRTPPVSTSTEGAPPKSKASRKITRTIKDELDLEF
jgi:hypothetical protein